MGEEGAYHVTIWNVVIPANTTAILRFPTPAISTLPVEGKDVALSPGLSLLRREGDLAVLSEGLPDLTPLKSGTDLSVNLRSFC